MASNRGLQITHFGGIKQYKSMVVLRDFPYNNVLFGLVNVMTSVKYGSRIPSGLRELGCTGC